jgi:hypothetical protein
VSGVQTVGPIFRTFFSRGKSLSAENSAEFLGKSIFQNFFCGKFHFSQHFWGKIFRGIFPKNFPQKKVYEKSTPVRITFSGGKLYIWVQIFGPAGKSLYPGAKLYT